jgi:hypothetical protein
MTALVPVASLGVAGLAGIDPTAGMTLATAATGDTFPADNEMWLRCTNTGATPVNIVVTFPAGSGPRGSSLASQTFGPVPITTGDRVFGPFPPFPYADGNGNVNIQASVTGAGVKVGALKFSG